MNKILSVLFVLMACSIPQAAFGPQVAFGHVHKEASAETMAAFKALQLLDHRMNAVGYRLVSANAAFCAKKQARAGLLLHDLNQYADKKTARVALGFNDPVEINAIAPGSPAAAAGLMAADGLIEINGQSIANISLGDPALLKEKDQYRRLAAINKTLSDALGNGETKLTIRRGGLPHKIMIRPVQTCRSNFQIKVSDDRNASATGELISISSKLAEYFISDDEFAAVVAHELAHNLLNHRGRLNEQKVNRGFFGQFGKSAGRIKETEVEADRLSVWLMANAGYEPQAAIRFWTRYGKQYGKGIFSSSTHYRWRKRIKLFDEEIARMKAMEQIDGKFPPPLLTVIGQ